jgi:cytochrome c
MRRAWIAAVFALALPFAAAAQDWPAGNAENGGRLFNQCRACHTVNEGGRNGVGPNLHRVIGRPAASIEAFRYSQNMRELAGQGWSWSEENLRRYLANPKDPAPQGSMSFQGFRDNRQNIADVIAYLRTQGGG